jgi:SAM-dependent methyltransferase
VYSWKEYWDGVARSYGWTDSRGLAPVLHPGAPQWFNATIDRLQHAAWRRVLNRCGVWAGSLALDVGCGTGRWVRRYSELNINVVGLDATQDMLRRAISGGVTSPLIAARAQHLPFGDSSFDLVSDVTVVQHLPPAEQPTALREMARVLRPGGHLLLIELIKGQGEHIFPRAPKDWIQTAGAAGLELVFWEGQEFLLFDQVFVTLVHAVRRLAGENTQPALPAQSPNSAATNGPTGAFRRIYWAARRACCATSELAEPLARAVCPAAWATHAVFLFQKLGAT